MAHLITPEQAVVDRIRIQMTDEPHLANSEVAGVMMMSRMAYRAGVKAGVKDCVSLDEIKEPVMAELPRFSVSETVTQVCEVYQRTFEQVVASEENSHYMVQAFMEGCSA